MKKNQFALGLILAAISLSASAKGPNPFTDCGVGAALFPDTNWAAVTSNATWDLGSTALTSATASPDTCTKNGEKTALYIRDSYDQIIEESARGENKHLVAALDIYGCNNAGAAAKSVTTSLKTSVSSDAYGTKQHIEKSADLYNFISTACGS